MTIYVWASFHKEVVKPPVKPLSVDCGIRGVDWDGSRDDEDDTLVALLATNSLLSGSIVEAYNSNWGCRQEDGAVLISSPTCVSRNSILDMKMGSPLHACGYRCADPLHGIPRNTNGNSNARNSQDFRWHTSSNVRQYGGAIPYHFIRPRATLGRANVSCIIAKTLTNNAYENYKRTL
eukprot:scaffold128490_cov19-Prasinocladus_malaysianus.AAC.1